MEADMRRRNFILIVLGIVLLLTGCQSGTESTPSEPVQRTNFVLGTVVTVTLFDNGTEEILDKVFDRLLEIENLMSANLDASDIGQVNLQAGKDAVAVSKETFEVVEKAIAYGQVSEGTFDITMEPVVKLWNIGTSDARIPEGEELTKALSFVNYKQIVLDADKSTVYLPEEGMGLDLGGIAKGYAADEIVRLLEGEGVTSAMLNLGGNVFAMGAKVDGSNWNIGIQNPFDERNQYFGIASIKNQTVVTSGPYERYFEEDGKRYHHIFNTTTGYPVENNIASVTVIASTSMDGDALSTTLFALGIDEGLKLVETLENVDCIFVDYDKKVTVSSGLKDTFVIEDSAYSMNP